MRLVRARTKMRKDFPLVEFCCDDPVMIQQQESFGGQLLIVDMDNMFPYDGSFKGHCRQTLGYKLGVVVVEPESEKGNYVPLDLLDLDEGLPE